MNPTKAIENNHIKLAVDPILPLWMNQAKTIWKNSLKLQMTLFSCCCGKIQNNPILPRWMNPAKAIEKNHINFAVDPILPLWMNQAKTI